MLSFWSRTTLTHTGVNVIIFAMHLKLYVITVFLICYCLIVSVKKHPLPILYTGVLLLLLSPALSLKQAFCSINLNVMGIFWGTMVLSFLFVYSGVPNLLASKLVNKTKSVAGAFLVLCAMTAFISSFSENISTILIMAPLAIETAKKLDVSPVPLIIGMAVSSNLQGCATMIGDSPSIILAMESNMSFNDFFWMQGKPGIFFAVELAALGSFVVLFLIFKKYRGKTKHVPSEKAKTWIPGLMIIGLVTSLIIASSITRKPAYTLGSICVFWGIIAVIWHHLQHREALNLVRGLDWQTFFFLIGIFVLVGSLTVNGIINDLAQFMIKITGASAILSFILLIVVSVIISAFVDNIPYTIAMIPVAQLMARTLGVSPYPFLFGLLVGTCVGGNITPIGASCNIAAVGILRKNGYRIGFMEFVRIGLPFTIVTVTIASLFIWLVWM